MSLQVWLPLTKDLRNQGLSDVTVTNNGATYSSTGGKLGGCYTFDGNDYIRISMPSEMTTLKGTSVAAWVKSTSSTLALGGISNDVNYTVPMCTLYTSGWQFGNDAQNGYRYVSGGTIANTNTWHHVCCTVSDTTITTYLDGVQVTSGAISGVTTFTNANFIEIGCDHPGGDEYLTGSVNDFRIYDHVLSQMEVKELSKGLILHYPLNRGGWGQENLISNSQLNGSWTYPSSSYSDKYSPTTLIVPSKSVYTLSFDAKSTVNGDKIRTHYYSPNTTTTCTSNQGVVKTATDGNMDFTLTTSWKRYWVIYNQSETTAIKHIICPRLVSGNGTGTVSVRNVKFEEGSIATPWCPNSSDTLATAMGLNGTTEYDCSGFCNNGTRTGTFSWTSDTPKYQVSTAIEKGIVTSTNSFITTADPVFSVALWFKLKSDVTYTAYTDLISFSSSSYSNQPFRLEICGSPVGKSIMWFRGPSGQSGGFAVKSDLSFDTWYHTVLVSEGNKQYSYYVNGEKLGTYNGSANSWTPTGNVSLGENISGVIYESDFRIYATALSADDVKSLYQNSAYIDSSGNVYGAVHSEV